MSINNNHPEQDPVEGSRETVEHDLKQQEAMRVAQRKDEDDPVPQSSPGAEAAEPSPGG